MKPTLRTTVHPRFDQVYSNAYSEYRRDMWTYKRVVPNTGISPTNWAWIRKKISTRILNKKSAIDLLITLKMLSFEEIKEDTGLPYFFLYAPSAISTNHIQLRILLNQNKGITHKYWKVYFMTGSTYDQRELCKPLSLMKNDETNTIMYWTAGMIYPSNTRTLIKRAPPFKRQLCANKGRICTFLKQKVVDFG